MIKNNFISTKELEAQEHFSIETLKKIECKINIDNKKLALRPLNSYQQLMVWAEDAFSSYLKDTTNLNKFVHNRIIIDGAFFKYCNENKISIFPLYKDSIISWNTVTGSEKFFVQGVFLVEGEDFEFLQCSLYHKGNQNEDEISFFIIVSENSYSKYLQLRNNYEKWSVERDRSNCLIRVVGGEDLFYNLDNKWEDLFLPEEDKKEIKLVVESFLSSQDFYIKNKIPWKTGVILWGPPGNGKSSLIKTIISNYNFKPVTITPSADDNMVREAFAYAEEQSPSLLYFEDLDSLLEKNIDLSNFLNLMDGIVSKNGIMVLATANDFSKLKPSITDRPSRFDRKLKISLPDQKMAYIYLHSWFGRAISVAKLKNLAKTAVQYHFSYAYLKELYVSSMFEALSKKRKEPTEKDIDSVMNRLIKDKKLNNKQINTERYFL